MMTAQGDWCNCQAIPGTFSYPGPWHEFRGEAHYPCAQKPERVNLLDLEAGICSCGNKFGGDNLCMVSACQWEGFCEHVGPCSCSAEARAARQSN